MSGARPASRQAATAWRSSVTVRPDRVAGLPALKRHVEELVASPEFDASRRSRQLLRFIADEALAGRVDTVTESAIAAHVFGREEGFDPRLDPIVRLHAGCLRRSLARYYALSGREDDVRIDLPRGTFRPVFRVPALPGAGSPRP